MDLSLALQIFVITEWPGSTCNHPKRQRPTPRSVVPAEAAAEVDDWGEAMEEPVATVAKPARKLILRMRK